LSREKKDKRSLDNYVYPIEKIEASEKLRLFNMKINNGAVLIIDTEDFTQQLSAESDKI
jgi:hypothetical protein